MGNICKHGVDCFKYACSECMEEKWKPKGIPKVDPVFCRPGVATKPCPSLDDYDR